MNRKLVPLLGIAFVVAVICTGVFYGLFAGKLKAIAESDAGSPVVLASRNLEPGTVVKKADLRVTNWTGSPPKGAFSAAPQAVGSTVLLPIAENEPLMPTRAPTAHGPGGGGLAVPRGMRAVSVHVFDSAGVLELAGAGQKVDLQVYVHGQDGTGQLRTMLQDVAVLGKGSSDGVSKPAIVTVLVTPQQADMLALADTSARLRMTLRNPLDNDHSTGDLLTLASLTRGTLARSETLRTASPSRHESKPASGTPRLVARRVQFRVRIIEAGRRVSDGFSHWLSAPSANDVLQVSALRPDFDVESEVRGWREKKGVSVVSSSSVSAANNREVSVQAADQSTAVRLRFVPAILGTHRLSLRVQPEVISSGWSRKIETEVELSDGQSFLVTGLSPAGSSTSSLMVLVTPQLEKPIDTASLKRER